MKFNVFEIVRSHVLTLANYGTGKISPSDILAFYGLPLALGVTLWAFGVCLPDEAFSASISVFSIFSALLFSAQVAMYGVFKADRKTSEDPIAAAGQRKRFEESRGLLREVNSNISYLILTSFTFVTIFFVLYVWNFSAPLESAILGFCYTHFALTLLMVIKRSHVVFDSEYSRSTD